MLEKELAQVKEALRRARGQEVSEPFPLETPVAPGSAFGRALGRDDVRICGILASGRVTTVEELLSMSVTQVLRLPNMGRKHLEVIERALTPRGQSFREE